MWWWYKKLIFLNMILRVFSSGCTSFPGEPVQYMDVQWTLMCYALKCLMHHMEQNEPTIILQANPLWWATSWWTHLGFIQVPSIGSLIENQSGMPLRAMHASTSRFRILRVGSEENAVLHSLELASVSLQVPDLHRALLGPLSEGSPSLVRVFLISHV